MMPCLGLPNYLFASLPNEKSWIPPARNLVVRYPFGASDTAHGKKVLRVRFLLAERF